MEHRINLEPGTTPPFGPLYLLSDLELRVLREYLKSYEDKGWVRQSTSATRAPIIFVKKKDGNLYLYMDYQGLNKITIKDRTPLPLISKTLDRLGQAKVFTKFDLKDAYHRIRIREGDKWKTAFRTWYGYYEYYIVPFGLSNAPATFQAYINKVLAGLMDITYVVYLNDILIYSEDESKYTEVITEVLQRLREFKLYANLKKYKFGITEVNFLGFIVGMEGVRIEEG
jgi:hypothetical protein